MSAAREAARARLEDLRGHGGWSALAVDCARRGLWSEGVEAGLLAIAESGSDGPAQAAFIACLQNAYDDMAPRLDALRQWLATMGGSPNQAIDRLAALFAAEPQWRHAPRELSTFLVLAGYKEEAVHAYGWSAQPLTRMESPDRERARTAFDGLARAYDGNVLHQLYTSVFEKFVRLLPGLPQGAPTVDLCCGTGLVAEKLHDHLDFRVGIDISPGMVELAARKGRYGRLLVADAVEGLKSLEAEAYGAVLSCCALYFMPDLRPVARAAARVLRPGGVMVLSVDPIEDRLGEVRLTNPGEYAHSRSHLRRAFAAAGFRDLALEIMLHRAYPGFYAAFVKSD